MPEHLNGDTTDAEEYEEKLEYVKIEPMTEERSMALITGAYVRQGRYYYHPSFEDEDAETIYESISLEDANDTSAKYLSNDLTLALLKQMHYAAYRLQKTRSMREKQRWTIKYFDFRNVVIQGNRKLVFKPARQYSTSEDQVNDKASALQLVLVKAVEGFDPWRGLRFSTFAVTCFLRHLAGEKRSERRKEGRQSTMPDEYFEEEMVAPSDETTESFHAILFDVERFLNEKHTLLADREKTILRLRFFQPDPQPTLEQIGREVGISKERVRQIQAVALAKIRKALLDELAA